MDETTLLDQLSTANVIHEADNGETLQMDEAFTASVETNIDYLQSTDDLELWLRDRVDELEAVGALHPAAKKAPELVATYLALRSRLAEIPSEKLIQLALVLNQLRTDVSRTDGTPDSFLPVVGNQLPLLLDLQSLAVVYCWREECEPCDEMKDTLETSFEEYNADISRFSVYGPNSARRLQEEYGVKGAPTTLFVVNGQVDSRLHGAHYEETIKKEIEKICEAVREPPMAE